MEVPDNARFTFNGFELDCSRRSLSRDGETLDLHPKTFDLLKYLVENHGKLLSKNELLDNVWPGQFVEENNLTVQISALRKVFGGPSRLIVTVPGKGYSFVADVACPEHESEMVVERHTVSHTVIDEEISRPGPAALQVRQLPAAKGSRLRTLGLVGLAAVALASLAAAAFWTQSKPVEDRVFVPSKLTTSGKVRNIAFTPDARYAVYSQAEAGGESLWLRQISTGSQQQVLATRPVQFVGLAVTPDSGMIYATTFAANAADPQLWRLPLLGGPVEEIKGITTGAAVSFSPDGSRMAFTESRSSQREIQLLTANSDGTNKTVLARAATDARTFPNFFANPVAWSPDGKLIACAFAEQSPAVRSGIILVDPDTGVERVMSGQRWDLVDHISWIDGENLGVVGYSTDTSSGQIWSVPLAGGEARRITNDLNNYSWLASADGRLLTVQKNATSRVMIGDFDESLESFAPRTILTQSGFVDNVALTADGRVLFTSTASGKREIWRMNSDGSDAEQLTVGANVTFGISVSPADGSIVFCSSEYGKHSLKIVDSEGKDIRQLTDGPEDAFPSFLPDGQSVVYQKGLINKIVTLRRVSVDDRAQSEVTQKNAIRPAVSFDGSAVAYYFMDAETDDHWRIGLVSAQDGSHQGKLKISFPLVSLQMRWHPSGKFIGQIVNDGEEARLLIIPIDGGPQKTVSGLGTGLVTWFEWSNVSKTIVIAIAEQSQDIVLMTN